MPRRVGAAPSASAASAAASAARRAAERAAAAAATAAPTAPTAVTASPRDAALGIVVQTAVQQLCEFLERGNGELEPMEREMRQLLVTLLNKLPFVCRSLIADATADVRFVYVMFYERVRMGASGSGFFLEAVGRGLPLLTGHAPVVLPQAQVRATTYGQVIQDRVATIARLECSGMRGTRLATLVAQHRLNDVPAAVPGRVQIFVSRARSLAQGLVAAKPASCFAQCRNRACNRRFFLSTLHGVGDDGGGGADVDGAADAPAGAAASAPAPPPPPPPLTSEPSYWELANTASPLLHLPASFCTWSCSQEWLSQLRAAVPTDEPDALAADEHAARSGRARVTEGLRLVVKRNEQEARKLRAIDKERRRFPAVSGRELRAERVRRVRSLNIDLGVLYAASVVAESQSLSAGKVLPAASRGWRSRPRFYAAAVRRVAEIYDKHHRGDAIISNVLGHWPFLVKLRERAGKIF